MRGRLMPPLVVAVVVAVCVGISTSYWIAGSRAFDAGFIRWLSGLKEDAKPRTPPAAVPQPDPGREAALQGQQEATLALREASAAVVEAREVAARWESEVVPLLKNYDGHLLAANPDLVQRFRLLYRSGPEASAVASLEGRLGTYNAAPASDLGPRRAELVALRNDALSLRDRYRRGLSDAAEIVALARARGLWSPIELHMAMWSQETGYGVRPGGPNLPPGSYYVDIPPQHPVFRPRFIPPPPVFRPPIFVRPYPPRWHNP